MPIEPASVPMLVVSPDDVLAQSIDFDAHLQGVPSFACTKGHFVNQLGEYVRRVRPEAYPEFVGRYPDTYPPFGDVPLRGTLKRGLDAARMAHPDVPHAQALRLMGRAAWGSVLDTMLGRAMFTMAGRDLDVIFRVGARAYEMFESRGTRVRYDRFGDGHFRYEFRNCFNWIDSYHVGVIEGVASAFGGHTLLRVRMKDRYNGSIDCFWTV